MAESSEIVADQQKTQSRLIEYQVCQQTISHHSSNYWNMASVFIAFSSVLLSAILVVLFKLELSQQQIDQANVSITIISVGMFIIYCTFFRWIKRVGYLHQICYKRMRQIEIKEGMLLNLIITGADNWCNLKQELNQDETIQLNEQELQKLQKYCYELKNSKGYARAGRNLYLKIILGILAVLWLGIIVWELVCYIIN